jgi:VWFA-related protein
MTVHPSGVSRLLSIRRGLMLCALCALPGSGASPITINISASDAKGQPITGLTNADFRIFDDGKLQPSESLQPAAADSANKSGPRSTMILLDLLNDVPRERNYEVIHIERALGSLEAGNSVYLYILTNQGNVYPVHGLPTPRPTIRMAGLEPPEQPEPAGGPPWTLQVRPLLGRAIQDVLALRPMDSRDEGIRAMAAFQTLGDVGRQFLRIRGTKTIVWISTGAPNVVHFPYGCHDVSFVRDGKNYLAGKCRHDCTHWPDGQCVDFAPFLRTFSRDLNAGETTICSVEETGKGVIAPADPGNGDDTLRLLANLTGGRIYAGGDVEKAIDQAQKDQGAKYRFTYSPAARDGKYHRLRVECVRKGVKVEAARVYLD